MSSIVPVIFLHVPVNVCGHMSERMSSQPALTCHPVCLCSLEPSERVLGTLQCCRLNECTCFRFPVISAGLSVCCKCFFKLCCPNACSRVSVCPSPCGTCIMWAGTSVNVRLTACTLVGACVNARFLCSWNCCPHACSRVSVSCSLVELATCGQEPM